MPNLDLLQNSPNSIIVNHFEHLEKILLQNTYIKDTTNKLHRIIEDSKAHHQVLLIGKERVGKSTLINAILGRDLIPIEESYASDFIIFIKYSEVESMIITFNDGHCTTFDLAKFPFIMRNNIEVSDILREHIDYITLYVNNSLLKEVTLIDTHALEFTNYQSAYFSEIILNRVDEILWIIKVDSPATDEELMLLEKISTKFMKPHLIVSGIDQSKSSINKFIESERARYGKFIDEIYPVSAKLAMQAKKMNQAQFLIDSRFPTFIHFVHQLSLKKEKKQQLTYLKLQQWLLRFIKELEQVTQREPYSSAIEQVELYYANKDYEQTREQRDLEIVKSYQEDFKECSIVFKGVETLYQLLQALSTHLFLRDEYTEAFEDKATKYLEVIRSYRNLHSEYEVQMSNLKKYVKFKNNTDEIIVQLLPKAKEQDIQDLIILLNEKQNVLASLLTNIKEIEQILKLQLAPLKEHVWNLVHQKQQSILNQVEQINVQRVQEHKYIVSASAKLVEFDCLIEAQNYIVNEIAPLIEADTNIYESTKQGMLHAIKTIHALKLKHTAIKDHLTIDAEKTTPIDVSFSQQYIATPLEIKVEDIISGIPSLPAKLVI